MSALDLIRTAVAQTFRSKLRTTLTVLALFVGAFTLSLTTALGAGVSDYVAKQVAALGADDVLLISAGTSAATTDSGPQLYDPETSTAANGTANPLTGGGALTPADVSALERIDGLSAVTPLSAVAIDWIEGPSGDRYEFAIAPTSSIAHADLAAGTQLAPEASENQITVPLDYVEALGIQDAQDAVGRTVQLGFTDVLGGDHTIEATIVGVSNTSLLNAGAGANTALVDEVASRQRAGSTAPERYQAAVATFDPGAGQDAVDRIKAEVSAAGMTAQTVQDQLGLVQTVIGGITGVLTAFAVIALLAAAFGIVNTLLMSVQERTREIGLMKAMGESDARVFALFSIEAAVIGLLGSVLGVAVAVLVGLPLNAALAQGPLSGLAGLDLLLFQPQGMLGVVALIVVLAFVAGTLPARRASLKTPIDALRYE